MTGPNDFSLPALNWLRYPEGDDPIGREPVPGRPLAEILDAAAAVGFGAVGVDRYTVRDMAPADVGAMLAERGLACTDVGVLPIGTSRVHEEAAALAGLASATGARICIAALFAPVERSRVVAELDWCGAVLGDSGARLALEFASYGGLTDLAEAIGLCESVGWERCGLLVDTWHFLRTGAPWAVLRSLRGEQIALVHVNDGPTDPGDDLVHEGRFGRLPVGAGEFPLTRFAAALEDAGYDGPVSTEVLSDAIRNAPTAEGARTLAASLRDGWPGHGTFRTG